MSRIDVGASEVRALRRLDMESSRPDEVEPVSIVKQLEGVKRQHDEQKKQRRR